MRSGKPGPPGRPEGANALDALGAAEMVGTVGVPGEPGEPEPYGEPERSRGSLEPTGGAAPAQEESPVDRRRLEDALRASENRFRAAFVDAGIGMALVDQDDLIIEANPALAEMLGHTVPELIRLHIRELMDVEERSRRVHRQLVRGELDRFRRGGM